MKPTPPSTKTPISEPTGSDGDERRHRNGPPSSPASSDLAQLLDKARDGDEEAMHQLVLRVLPRVRNAVRYLVRGDHIDDLVQDVLVTILQRLDSYAGTGRFEAWVDGVTLRVVLGRTRSLRKLERRRAAVDADDVRLLHSGERYATTRQLARALDQLPEAQRTALVMHHAFGLTAPEIGKQLRVPHETVRSRLRHGMGQLRALLRVGREQDPETTDGA
ncbi:MAG: RNA polymerase sigma factor [Myxococcales bacterium]|nr:RNA polymerase sigma factor [Myxococcales bacterium]MDD9965459.1 RNA polymerase sigma factor [Myxococcales bacterium]